MTVKEYLTSTFEPHNPYCVRKPIVCADGFKVSVQGGTGLHYCLPRCHCNEYEEVELGFPSMKDDLIMEYAENKSNLTKTVYGWVPFEVADQLVENHGGIIDSTLSL